MARTRFLVSVCTACVVGSGLVPGVAQAARLLLTATPPARPTASLVDDLAPGPASSNPRDLTAMNGRLFFTAWTPRHGRQLWRTDGTVKGTVMLTHVRSPVGANPQDLTVANGVLFFAARDPLHGQELWKSDGTAAGTGMVRDIVRRAGRLGSHGHHLRGRPAAAEPD